MGASLPNGGQWEYTFRPGSVGFNGVFMQIKAPSSISRLFSFSQRKAPGTAPGRISPPPAAQKPVVTATGFSETDFQEVVLRDLSELDAFRARWETVWINVDGLGDHNLIEEIGRLFALHPLALEDVSRTHQRPKVEDYEDHLFVVLRALRADDALLSEQVSLFLGSSYVLTFQEQPGDAFDEVRERIRRSGTRVRQFGADFLAYALIDAVVDAYFPVLEQRGERLEELELAIFNRPEKSQVAALFSIRAELMACRRAIWPLRELLSALSRDKHPNISAETRVFIRDAYDHAIMVMDMVETYREVAKSLIDVYLSTLGHRTNEVMQVLTIIATLFIPLTFVAGIYGMNFDPAASA
jgi:magnesium transporter